jgi:hypothetical protein
MPDPTYDHCKRKSVPVSRTKVRGRAHGIRTAICTPKTIERERPPAAPRDRDILGRLGGFGRGVLIPVFWNAEILILHSVRLLARFS